jgi:hypothetical protein
MYFIDPNRYDISEARMTPIRCSRVFAAVTDASERCQWIDRNRILPKNDDKKAIFEVQERSAL